jgi:uncharacterized membrane protein (DUF4010 family)
MLLILAPVNWPALVPATVEIWAFVAKRNASTAVIVVYATSDVPALGMEVE